MHTRDVKTRLKKQTSLKGIVEILHNEFSHYTWVGVYRVEGGDLVLEAWKGPQATQHVRIPIGKGICGSAARTGQTELVRKVSDDSRYLTCFRSTRSEIVVPIKNESGVVGEIDIDSDTEDAFSQEDKLFLEEVASELARRWGDFERFFSKSPGGIHGRG
jgi:GAF domain-containing protein